MKNYPVNAQEGRGLAVFNIISF